MFSAKKVHMLYVKQAPFYLKEEDGNFVIFKEGGVTLEEMGVKAADLPNRIFVMPKDRALAIKEIQSGLNHELVDKIKANDLLQVRNVLNDVIEVTFSEVSSENLENLNHTVEILRAEYQKEPAVIRSMSMLGQADYTTAAHSLNVMCLTMSYALQQKMAVDKCQSLGLAALLHDVGKTEVDQAILNAPRRLTDEEFEQIRQHPMLGYRMLVKCNFKDKSIPLVALQHHEKIDGSGYPKKMEDISTGGRLVAIIDCYEAITADDRPYRSAAKPFDALSIIREEVDKNKFDGKIFEKFISSLT